MEKKTPLYDRHAALGGKIVPFAGYLMPVQYASGVIAEHMAVRTQAGLFDVSHMGEFMLTGPDALANLNHLLTNDFSNMVNGQVRYSPLCNFDGGIVDDLIVYRYDEEKYLIVVNASNREKDFDWMQKNLQGNVELLDISDTLCEIALQGPNSKAIISKLCSPDELPQKYYYFVPSIDVGGIDCIVSRTGYTGEFGYELYAPVQDSVKLWDMLLNAGADEGIIPCGLGARDTLRLEASMPLYGHEMDDTVSPLETGLNWAVKLDTHDFIGKDKIIQSPVKRTRIGLKVTGKGIVREHQDVNLGEEKIGQTTSGTHLPFLGGAYAMALVDIDRVNVGDEVTVDVRGRKVPCAVVALPFYKREKK